MEVKYLWSRLSFKLSRWIPMSFLLAGLLYIFNPSIIQVTDQTNPVVVTGSEKLQLLISSLHSNEITDTGRSEKGDVDGTIDIWPKNDESFSWEEENRKRNQKAEKLFLTLNSAHVDNKYLMQFFADSDNNEEKQSILEHVWSKFTMDDIDPEFENLIALALSDPDENIYQYAQKIQSDINRLKNHEQTQLQVVKERLDEIRSRQLGHLKYVDSDQGLFETAEYSHDSFDRIVDEVKALTLYSDDIQERQAGLMLLRDVKPEAVFEVIENNIYQVRNEGERFFMVETIRSMIGNIDSTRLVDFFDSVGLDYNPQIVELAEKSKLSIEEYELKKAGNT